MNTLEKVGAGLGVVFLIAIAYWSIAHTKSVQVTEQQVATTTTEQTAATRSESGLKELVATSTKIRADGKPYHFAFFGGPSSYSPDDVITQIRITNPDGKTQSIDFTDGVRSEGILALSLDASNPFVDYNFDGFLDLSLDDWMASGSGGTASEIWLYNPTTDEYEYNKTLSYLGNLRPDPKTKTLYSSWHSGAANYWIVIFAIDSKNVLTPVHTESVVDDPDKQDYSIRTVWDIHTGTTTTELSTEELFKQ